MRDTGVYHGKQAKTGNSLGLRFERALFPSHPEFSGEVEARIIGPGRMLWLPILSRKEGTRRRSRTFLIMSFLAAAMQHSPEHIRRSMPGYGANRHTLVSNVNTSPEEDLGDEGA